MTFPTKSEPKVDHVFASPGEIITVKLECNRCENRRWPAVNPMRNVLRGLRCLDDGDEAGAREFFNYAVELLRFLAQHTDEPPQPEERTDALDRAETVLRQVAQLVPARGSKAALSAIADYFGKAA